MHSGDLVERTTAVERVLDRRSAVLSDRPTTAVSLDAVGQRTLAAPVVADEDRPPESLATMDGFAFDASDDYPLELVGDVFPEDDPPPLESGAAVRIATGAPLPEGADAVLKREDATVTEEGDTATLTGPAIDPGTDAYERGSNVRAGERLFDAGERLSPRDAILLRDLGVESVTVHEPFSVGVLATGSELVDDPASDLDSPALAGLVESWGHDPVYEGAVPDEFGRVRSRLDELATTHDVVLTTGGTSVGRKDYTVRALADLGEVRFHGVRIRPGKPVALAALPDHDATAVAIPGKPLGAHTSATLVARPLFTGEAALPATPARATVDVDVDPPGFEYWIPVTLDGDDEGSAEDDALPDAVPLGHADSACPVYEGTFDPSVVSATTRVTRADGFVATREGLESDAIVDVVPYGAVE